MWYCLKCNYFPISTIGIGIADILPIRRGVDPGGDEGDASPPALEWGGWTIQSSPPALPMILTIIIIQTKK